MKAAITATIVLMTMVACSNVDTNQNKANNRLFDRLPITDDTHVKPTHIPQQPYYPTYARMNQAQGDIEMEVIVNEIGVPIRTKIISGRHELYQAAKEYALNFRFEPISHDGKPTIFKIHFTCQFRLR